MSPGPTVVYRSNASPQTQTTAVPVAQPAPSLDMDALVDTLVDRLERRVLEELERRSRNRYPGVF